MVRIHPYKLFRTVIRASLTDQALSLTQTILWGKEEDISALLNTTPVDEHTLQGTPLIAAASVGRPDIVWRLLERGFNPKATTEIDNQTALYQAAERGHIQVVELLSLKTEKDIFTWSTWTPLHVAAISGHALIVKCLLNAEFNQNAQTNAKMTALAYAAQQGHLGVMKVLLEWGVVDPPDGRLSLREEKSRQWECQDHQNQFYICGVM